MATKKDYVYKRIIQTDDNVIYEEGYLPYDLFDDFNIEKCEGSILKYFEDDKGIQLTHDRKDLKSVLVAESHVINKYSKEKIGHSIETVHNLYSNNQLLQVSKQIKQNSDITIVST